MKLSQFVSALLPSLDKSKIVEDLRVTIAELDHVVICNYQAASDQFRANKIKSDKNKDLSDSFYRNLNNGKIAKQTSFIGDVYKRLPAVKENAVYVLGQIESILERDVIREGLTAKKILFIRAAESISFISRFSLDLLNCVYVNETNEVDGDISEALALSPGVTKTVSNNVNKFAMALSTYSTDPSDFQKTITEVPEIIVNAKTSDAISGVYDEETIDPFTNGYVVGFTMNPIYHVRLMIAEWQANRYKANKDKKKVLELRLLYLKLSQEKKKDPKVEKEIEYIQNRVDKIERYLRDVEESLKEGD